MREVPVALGERSYLISLGHGNLADAAWWDAEAPEEVVAIVTDSRVAPLYLRTVSDVLAAHGRRIVPVVVDASESAKDWTTLDQIYSALLRAQCDRQTLIVALGGGVIGDLAGFAAATYMRGVPFVQVPTTLLAQVDSSIGGKTGINHVLGKNMVGAFYQPRAVLIDIATLASLPPREVAAGMAEVVKHGAACDRAYLDRLDATLERVIAQDEEALAEAIAGSCVIKAAVVAADERESGARAVLNFGHTFGHAIEAGLGFGTWLHGEAVAAGMIQAAHLSQHLGSLERADVRHLADLIRRCKLPQRAPDFGQARWLELMAQDKKASGGAPRFVLLRGLGSAYVSAVAQEPLAAALAETATVPVAEARRPLDAREPA